MSRKSGRHSDWVQKRSLLAVKTLRFQAFLTTWLTCIVLVQFRLFVVKHVILIYASEDSSDIKIASTYIRYSDYVRLNTLISNSNTTHSGLRTLSLLITAEYAAWEWYSYVIDHFLCLPHLTDIFVPQPYNHIRHYSFTPFGSNIRDPLNPSHSCCSCCPT